MCIGINLCSKKNCLEQERCLFPTEKAAKKVKINQCQIHKKFCANERACEILGQCILDHPLIKSDELATKELKKRTSFNQVVKIVTRLMPTLNRTNKRFHKKRK